VLDACVRPFVFHTAQEQWHTARGNTLVAGWGFGYAFRVPAAFRRGRFSVGGNGAVELLSHLLDFVLHIDVHLREIIESYGAWTYGILFAIIFLETGVVFTPFLPGDSLLFAAGAFGAQGMLNTGLLFVLLCAAAILGDTANYWIGRLFGPAILRWNRGRFIKQQHLDRTHAFFEKYGGKTIVLARFVPIVRTLAPFVAGIGTMNYGRFIMYNVVGGVAWVTLCLGAGHLFGNLEPVRRHFSLVVLAIIILSVLPMVYEVVRARLRAKRAASADKA
jgi:membrane-associated protein